MLAELLKFLYEYYDISWLRVVTYISFRSIAAASTSLLICLFLGPLLIKYLSKRIIEPIKEDAPKEHRLKVGKPTMGGFLIIFSTIISCVLWTDIRTPVVWLVLLSMIWMGFVGFIDDYKKAVNKEKGGMKEHYKLAGQIILGLAVGIYTVWDPMLSVLLAETTIPFVKNYTIDYGLAYIPVCIFIIAALSNAVNLTDGLDGLAAGCSAISLIVLAVFSYLTGNAIFSKYLNIAYIPNAGEVAVVSLTLAAACIGFLWFNTYPASIFMGDTGSLAIGSAIAVIALLIKKELLLPTIAGVFLVETLSVIIQRVYFKYKKKFYGKGERVFNMAPIHHHFQLKGWPEQKIVVRFWIIAIIFAFSSLISLKLR